MENFKTIVILALLASIGYKLIKPYTLKTISKTVSIDRNSYTLILATDARELFFKYNVARMHGLSLAEATSRIGQGGTYIDGLANYHPDDTKRTMNLKPIIFLNLKAIRNNYSNDQVPNMIMHECMHMAGIIYNGCWDSHEEQMITWAEDEANEVLKILKRNRWVI